MLIEPEIPQNTGNIARTCAAIGANLHLVKPLGFKIDDAKLKRAGLDYWYLLNIKYYEDKEEFFNAHPNSKFFFSTTKAEKTYSDVSYGDSSFLVFGKETAGLPEELLKNNRDSCIRIPMIEGARSLNLSNSVAIVAYEALRQNGFASLKTGGELTKYNWE